METILIRYAELGLKSEKVRSRFTRQLMDHITDSLVKVGIEHIVTSQRGRIFIETMDLNNTRDVLRTIPGIYSFSHVTPADSGFDDLMDAMAAFSESRLKEGMTFGIKVKRTGETDYTSKEIAINGGDAVCRHLDDSKVKVDLKDPDIWFEVEIRGQRAYLFTDRVKGMGGMPSATQGKVLLYLPPFGSLSTDDEEKVSRAVLSRLMLLRRGCRVIPVISRDDLEGWREYLDRLKEDGKEPFFIDGDDLISGLKDAMRKTGAMGLVFPGSEEDLSKAPVLHKDSTPISTFIPTIALSFDEVKTWLSTLGG